MEDLIIKKTAQTPKIVFKLNGELLIEGVSVPSNANDFYDPVVEWLSNLNGNLPPKINLTLQFDYFNTSSSLIIHGILKKLIAYSQKGVPLTINWKYDNDDKDMFEEGGLFENRVNYPFDYIPV